MTSRFRCKLCGIILMPYFKPSDCGDDSCPQADECEERPTVRVRTEDQRREGELPSIFDQPVSR